MTTMMGKICFAIAVLAPAASLAAPQSVTESARYTLADNDSRNDARQICVATAKRTALDKAGSLFESDLTAHTAEANGTVADDTRVRMRSYVAAVVGSEVVDEHFDVNNGRLTVSCTVRVTFDPDEVSKKLRDIAGTDELRRKIAAQQAQIEILENQVRALSATIRSSLPYRAAAAQPQLSGAPPAIANPALDQPAPSPEVAETPRADPPALPPLPPPRYVTPRPYAYAAPSVQAPAPAQAPRPTVTVYPPSPATVYYYRPAPVYAVPTVYGPRYAYAGWYYAPR